MRVNVKKYGSKVYGANLSVAERKAMDMEIQRQIAEYDKKNMLEIDAAVLWVLHEEFGFGETRLKRFFDSFAPAIDGLVQRYEMDHGDGVWLCTHKLKELGIDISEWEKERT